MSIMKRHNGGRRVAYAAAVLGMVLAAGCEVTNPGPVADEAVTLEASQQGFVNGAKERLVRALGQGAYSTSFIARELFPGGTTGSYGQGVSIQAGSIPWDDSGNNDLYDNLQQARWIAEEAVRRLATSNPKGTPQLMTEAYVWAGFANRMLGDDYCEAVIDGGALQPGSTYHVRAEKHFTDAIAAAPNTARGNTFKLAAYAGRAQVRLSQKNWAGASADAAMVTDLNWRFDLQMDFQTGANASQRNHLYFGAASTPYRSFSVKHTYYEQYYTDTGDPRTPWITYQLASDNLCVGSLQGYGRVPCLRPWKYKTENDPMRLASGREMRLIEAEVILAQNGTIANAMQRINQVRTSIRSDRAGNPSLAAWPVPATAAEAWTLLKRERGIELWLEMRRMGDQRRWDADTQSLGSYELPRYEAVRTPSNGDGGSLFRQYLRGRAVKWGGTEVDTPRTLCYNISNQERNANPNIDDYTG
jgi:hypothetical protein